MPDEPKSDDPMRDDPAIAELADLRAIARRVGSEPVAWETPPTGLWGRIAADLTHGSDAPPAPVDAGSHDGRADTGRPVAAIEPRRRRRSPVPWFAAAAAALVLVVAGTVLWSLRPDDPAVVARAELELLGATGEGRATLVERDGAFQLRLDTRDLDVGDDVFAEVWMINPDVTAMISLGPLRGDGRYELPAGLDPMAFPIVDISIEPFDGDPTHSGNSVLRGQLAS